MGKRLIFDKPGSVSFEEQAVGEPGPGQIKLRTVLSGISHGTEMVTYLGKSPFETMKITGQRLFVPREPGDPPLFPYRYAGYDLIGTVVGVGEGVTGFQPGDMVFAPVPHQDEVIVGATDEETVRLPAHLPPEKAIMLSLATVAFNAIQDAEIKLGDTVAIFGGGAVGQMAVQFALKRGAAKVYFVEPDASRREMVAQRYPVIPLDPTKVIPAQAILDDHHQRPPDVVVECSGSIRALSSAIQAAGVAGTVIAVGFYAGPATDLNLGAEFLTNRVTLKASMGVWGCPSRWPEYWGRRRNLETVLAMIADGSLDLTGFEPVKIPFAEAAKAYEQIKADPRLMKVALSYLP